MPIRPAKPIPNNIPEATRPRISGPCSVSTRGLPRLFRSTIAPIPVSTKPVNRLLFCMHSPPGSGPSLIPRRFVGEEIRDLAAERIRQQYDGSERNVAATLDFD